MSALHFVALVCVAISLGYYAASSVAAVRFAARANRPAPPLPKVPPKIAVLKPLYGINKSLTDNLVSFLENDYPRTNFFFGVDSYADPAAPVPASLRARYQFANLTMVVGEEENCQNKKIAKVIKMADRAEKADILVLSDADIWVERDYLRRVAGELMASDKIGVVTCAYRAVAQETLASRMEALFINTDFAPQVMLADQVEPMRYALGASIAIKRSALESIGGFRSVKDLLADDFYLGRFVSDRGLEVRLSTALVTIAPSEETLVDFWHHQLRWARTYRMVRPVSLATIVTHGPFWAILLAIASHGSASSLALLATVIAARVGMSAIMLKRVLRLPRMMRDLWLVPFKDLTMTAVWFASLGSNRVVWAGRKLKVLRGGMIREVKS